MILPVVTSIDLDELDLAPEPVTEEPVPEPAHQVLEVHYQKNLQKSLPQELDLAPEPVTEEPEPTPPSPRGSLPKESAEELSTRT